MQQRMCLSSLFFLLQVLNSRSFHTACRHGGKGVAGQSHDQLPSRSPRNRTRRKTKEWYLSGPLLASQTLCWRKQERKSRHPTHPRKWARRDHLRHEQRQAQEPDAPLDPQLEWGVEVEAFCMCNSFVTRNEGTHNQEPTKK